MNAFRFTHVVVATLNNIVHIRDELEIRVKNVAQISGSWCVQELLPRIYKGKEDAMTRIAYEQQFGFIRI